MATSSPERDNDGETSRESKRRRRRGIFETDDGWDSDLFDYNDVNNMLKCCGYEETDDPNSKEEIFRYLSDVRKSKGFDIENDTPLAKDWMHPVDHLHGPEAAIIERCARFAVNHFNAIKKGKKALQFERVVKAMLTRDFLLIFFITLEAKDVSTKQTQTYQTRVNYFCDPDSSDEEELAQGFDVQIFRLRKE